MLLSLLLAAAAVSLPLSRTGPYVFVDRVYVNGDGPFRFLVDTGAQSSAVTDRVAARLQLRPEARVELFTPAGAMFVPVTRASITVAGTGGVAEVRIGGIDRITRFDSRLDGVLGNDFFLERRFAIDFEKRLLTLDARVPDGERMPLRVIDGRFAVTAAIDGRECDVILDSGTPALVVFEPLRTQPVIALVATNSGTIHATPRDVILRTGRHLRRIRAVVLPGTQVSGGLLPLSFLRSVFVDGPAGYLVLR